jgi:type IV secretory pathway VirB3-like protein
MAEERDIEATSESLDVSMTQEPTILFIPFSLASILGISMFALGTFFHTWKVIFISVPLWVLAAIWTKRDRNAVRVFKVLLSLTRLWVTAHRWGGFSISPPGRV